MHQLNYHHLLYFWTVAREGGVSRAALALHLTQPTVSSQLRILERSVGERLFTKVGRKLALTETGRLVYRYADEIFSIGQELVHSLRGRPTGRPRRLVVGVADVLPKLIAYRILEPALRMPEPVQIICHEDKPERLLAELSLHGLDMILSDAPLPSGSHAHAFTHLLGESGLSVFAAPPLAGGLRRRFPRSLDGIPFLLPTPDTTLRRTLDRWFDEEGIRPQVVGEFDDNALLGVFGQGGAGAFVFPSVIEAQVRHRFRVRLVGRIPSVQEQYYVISVERKLKHPAVVAISDTARRRLFV
jgi:LysR family transcriptional activator of nhaA